MGGSTGSGEGVWLLSKTSCWKKVTGRGSFQFDLGRGHQREAGKDRSRNLKGRDAHGLGWLASNPRLCESESKWHLMSRFRRTRPRRLRPPRRGRGPQGYIPPWRRAAVYARSIGPKHPFRQSDQGGHVNPRETCLCSDQRSPASMWDRRITGTKIFRHRRTRTSWTS